MAQTLAPSHGLMSRSTTASSFSSQQVYEPVLEVPDVQAQTPIGLVVRGRLAPTPFSSLTVSCSSKIGKRKKQEDRCTFVSKVLDREDCFFFGVFDGTVGDIASEFANNDLPVSVCASKTLQQAVSCAGPVGSARPFGSAAAATAYHGTALHAVSPAPLHKGPGGVVQPTASSGSTLPDLLRQTVEQAFTRTDSELVKLCAEQRADYASSTAVTALLCGDLLTLGHLGDSRIVIGRELGMQQHASGGSMVLSEQDGGKASPRTTTPGGSNSYSSALVSSAGPALGPAHTPSATSGTPNGTSSPLGFGSLGMGGRVPSFNLLGSPTASTAAVLPPVSNGAWASMQLEGLYMTFDHKPDQPEERRRIEMSGGSLAYLHGGKPFIRGGDFTRRQAQGDRPMQLNYSRAFGGKDLKPFGLTAQPDVTQVSLTPADRLLILASDGLWDVASADVAVRRAAASIAAGRDPALDLVDYALAMHDLRGSVDNCTVIVVQLPGPALPRVSSASTLGIRSPTALAPTSSLHSTVSTPSFSLPDGAQDGTPTIGVKVEAGAIGPVRAALQA